MTPQEQPDSQAGDELTHILGNCMCNGDASCWYSRTYKELKELDAKNTDHGITDELDARQEEAVSDYANRLAAKRVAEARVELLKAQVAFNYSHAENVERLRLAEVALSDRLTKEGEQ